MADKTKKDTTHNTGGDSATPQERAFIDAFIHEKGSYQEENPAAHIRHLATMAAEHAKIGADAENLKLEGSAALFSRQAKLMAQFAVKEMDANPAAAKRALQTVQNPDTFEQDLRAAAKGETAEIAKLSQHSNQLSLEDRTRMTQDIEGWARAMDPNGNQATNASFMADMRYEKDHPLKVLWYAPASGETAYAKPVVAEYAELHKFYAEEAQKLDSVKDAKYAMDMFDHAKYAQESAKVDRLAAIMGEKEKLQAAGVRSAHDTDDTLKTPSHSHNASDKSMTQSKKNP